MKIKSLVLKKFKKFKINEIEKFSVDIHDRIQIIIGTNGSGKTSLLQELFPYSPNKSVFDKGGYKKLIIEKNGSIYELKYEYNKSKNEHSFKKDGEELNINHKFNLQEDLISKYLGIDQIKKKILTCDIDITRMSSKPRKDFFIKLNPINTEIIETKLKKAKSKVNAIKATLSNLYKRKNELIQKQLTKEELQRLKKTKKNLEKVKNNLFAWETRLKTLINEETKRSKPDPDKTKKAFDNINKIKPTIDDLIINLYKYYTFDGRNIEDKINNTKIKIKELTKRNDKLKKDIEEKIAEVEKLSDIVLNKADSDHIEESKTKIEKLLKEKNKLSKYDFSHVFTKKEMEIFKEVEIELINKINILIDIFTIKILPTDIFNKIYNKKMQIKSKIDVMKTKMDGIDIHMKKIKSDLEKMIEEYNEDELPEICDKFNCYLYTYYSTKKNNLLKQIDNLKTQYDEINKKHKKYLKIFNLLDNIYTKNLEYRKIAIDIKKSLDKLPTHVFLIDKEKFLELLNTFPNKIIVILKSHYKLSEKYYLYQKIQDELIQLEKELSELINQNNINIAIIEGKIKILKSNIKSLQMEYIDNEKMIISLKNKIEEYNEYKDKYNQADLIASKASNDIGYLESLKSIEFYESKLEEIYKYKEKNEKALNEISNILKEQENIEIRLKEEVINEIEKLEYDKKDYILIEKSLEKLSSEYILSFVNNIINNTNFFINKIFTYPMKIKFIEDVNDLNFKFNILINDVLVNDISECSSGQKKIIDLCFCLALIIELNLQHLPFFVDEVDKALDKKHKQNLLKLFYYLIDENIISQLFAVVHFTPELEGLQGNVICMNEDNILLPPVYNTHVQIDKQ